MENYMVNVGLNLMSELENGVMIYGIFCAPITRKKPRLVMGLLCLIALCAGGDWYQYDEFAIEILRTLLSPMIWMFWIDGKCYRRIAIYICSIMYLGLPYLFINLLFSGISGETVKVLETFDAYHYMRGIFTIMAMGILSRILWKKITAYKEIMRNLPTGYFIVGSVCIFAASMVQSFVEEISTEYENAGLANFIFFCVIIVSLMFYALGIGSVVLDIFRKRYKEESGLKEQYLQIAKNYVKTVRDNAKETRKMRHDMLKHMNILGYHLENGEYGKAQAYLAEMQTHMEGSIKKTVSVNHEIVDAVLSQMQSETEGRGIRWVVDGALPMELPVGDFDLCTIFSNLLSNSIEACMQVEEGKRYIHLGIRHLGENLVIEVENSCKQIIEVSKLGDVTTKKDKENHGYGIQNIRDAVCKYHGELIFKSTEGKFVAQIVLRLS